MDVSISDATNHLDADILLPPRKRLLAGLKRQSCSDNTSQCSHENSQSPSLSPSPSSQAPFTEFDIRLNNLLKSYKNGSNMSPEEIANAARSAAVAAAKAAEAARAAAEEKAAVAAKAVADAKSALDLVASISEGLSGRDKHQRENKSKKQVTVQLLYKNCGKDKDLARKLHPTINNSPRTSRSSPADSKNHKHKKLKILPSNEKDGISNGKIVRDCNLALPLARNDGSETGGDCEMSSEKTHSVIMDDRVSKSSKADELEVTSREVKSPIALEDVCVNGRKRGRIKQKKLPLSICSFKDQTSPKGLNVKPVEVAPTRKCQDFQVSQCIERDKMVQS